LATFGENFGEILLKPSGHTGVDRALKEEDFQVGDRHRELIRLRQLIWDLHPRHSRSSERRPDFNDKQI